MSELREIWCRNWGKFGGVLVSQLREIWCHNWGPCPKGVSSRLSYGSRADLVWYHRFWRFKFHSSFACWLLNCTQKKDVAVQTMLADSEHRIAVCQCNFKFDVADFQDLSSSFTCRIASRMKMWWQCQRCVQIWAPNSCVPIQLQMW